MWAATLRTETLVQRPWIMVRPCYIYAYLCVYCVSIMYMYLCFIEQTDIYICGASIVIWFVLIYLCIYYVSVLIEQTEYIYVVCI